MNKRERISVCSTAGRGLRGAALHFKAIVLPELVSDRYDRVVSSVRLFFSREDIPVEFRTPPGLVCSLL
ncbi:hypothetical protein EVAR_32832_1 [Eumeta japonica]|uniref:Uncharacterized protein n=1 Tax=Eumeta variegata TaxID=151549 RepID=A0A4C1WBJ3_EUMVA|nr:hypothetical protein EVAR_32832_1 [Eumeta japonica]